MTSSQAHRRFGLLVVGVLIANTGWSAESSRIPSDQAPARSTAQRSDATRSAAARGPLPDPALLDGATQAVEKKSEYGMIGDFELPGDENVRNGKVGGPQNQSPATGSGQSGNQPMGLPQGGGGGGPQSPQQGGGQAGGPAQQGDSPPAGAGQAGGPENPNAAGNPVGGGGEPGAQPQGMQVAELGGNPSDQQGVAGVGGPGGRPRPVAIGDKAMRIEPTGAPPGTVGAPQKIADGHVQQHDKGTGTGGKAPTSPQGPGRVEKGRVIPAGL